MLWQMTMITAQQSDRRSGSRASIDQQPQNWRTLRQGKLNETYGSLDPVSLSLPPRAPRTRETTTLVCVCFAVANTSECHAKERQPFGQPRQHRPAAAELADAAVGQAQ